MAAQDVARIRQAAAVAERAADAQAHRRPGVGIGRLRQVGLEVGLPAVVSSAARNTASSPRIRTRRASSAAPRSACCSQLTAWFAGSEIRRGRRRAGGSRRGARSRRRAGHEGGAPRSRPAHRCRSAGQPWRRGGALIRPGPGWLDGLADHRDRTGRRAGLEQAASTSSRWISPSALSTSPMVTIGHSAVPSPATAAASTRRRRGDSPAGGSGPWPGRGRPRRRHRGTPGPARRSSTMNNGTPPVRSDGFAGASPTTSTTCSV